MGSGKIKYFSTRGFRAKLLNILVISRFLFCSCRIFRLLERAFEGLIPDGSSLEGIRHVTETVIKAVTETITEAVIYAVAEAVTGAVTETVSETVPETVTNPLPSHSGR